MAEIIYGLASSHGPLLRLPPEDWGVRADFDRRHPALAFRHGSYNFEELCELRKDDRKFFEAQSHIDVKRERHAACQKQLDALAEKFDAETPDVIVMVGDDQHEWFSNQVQPSFAMVTGPEVVNRAYTDEEKERLIAGGRKNDIYTHRPESDQAYRVECGLADAIMEHAVEDGFDLAAIMEQPTGDDEKISVGHAFGYIHRRIMRDSPVPVVPLLINTFYPPNQPLPSRCYDFGRMVGNAIREWGPGKRVVVAASGGASHFVVDEEWDDKMMTAFRARDTETFLSEPNIQFRDGTSEVKNWITVAGILDSTDKEMNLLDYVPCYRSEAGTGSGMAFATWT